MKTKLFIKYLALLSTIALAPFWFLSYRLTTIGQNSVKIALMELQLANAGAVAGVFDGFAANLAERTELLRNELVVKDWQGKLQLFNSFLEMNPEIANVSVISLSGQEIVRAISPNNATGGEKLVSYAGSADFSEAKSARNARSLYFSADSGSLTCFYPFGDKFFLRTEAALDRPLAALAGAKPDFRTFLVLADSHDRPLIPQELQDSPKRVLGPEVRNWPVFKAALRNRMGSGSMEFADSGGAMLGAYVQFRNAKGAAIIAQPLEIAFSNALFMKRYAVYSILAVTTMVLSALVLVSWRLAGRLSGELPPVESCFMKREENV